MVLGHADSLLVGHLEEAAHLDTTPDLCGSTGRAVFINGPVQPGGISRGMGLGGAIKPSSNGRLIPTLRSSFKAGFILAFAQRWVVWLKERERERE